MVTVISHPFVVIPYPLLSFRIAAEESAVGIAKGSSKEAIQQKSAARENPCGARCMAWFHCYGLVPTLLLASARAIGVITGAATPMAKGASSPHEELERSKSHGLPGLVSKTLLGKLDRNWLDLLQAAPFYCPRG